MQELVVSVPEKQSLLSNTTSSVIKSVQSTITSGCKSVDATSAMASTVLTNVQEATDKMQKSANNCLEEFTEFMNGTGNSLECTLQSHFQELGNFLAHQEQVAENTIEQSNKFKILSESSVVDRTGHTPVKGPYTPLKELR